MGAIEPPRSSGRVSAGAWLSALALLLLTGCSMEGIVGGVVGATLAGAYAPSHEVEQVYYLGAFDPDDQAAPSLYRITVRGQASFISLMRFASGWVPAPLIDSLGSRIQFNQKSGDLEINTGPAGQEARITPGRRLVMFGPEGFREAPGDHRLVVVMGSSPEEYFQAVDQVLGVLAAARRDQSLTPAEKRQIIVARLLELSDEQDRLRTLKSQFNGEVK